MQSHNVRALTTLLITGALLLVGAFAPQRPRNTLAAPAPVALAPAAAPLSLVQTPTSQNLLKEREPNNTPAQANPIASAEAVVRGNIYPVTDVDLFAVSVRAGDRIYAATMTAATPASTSNDSFLDLLAPDGSVLEADNDDGTFTGTSSAIASAAIPTAGTYYLRVRVNGNSSLLRFYDLHVQVQSGQAVAETEPNDVNAPQPMPASGFITGTIGTVGDKDAYALTLQPGDTVFASLDLDPERDSITWNGRLAIGVFNGSFLLVNDPNVTSPNAEASFMTVKQAGTYVVYADTAVATAGDPTLTYQLSVSVHRAQPQNCSSYASAAGSLAIGPGGTTLQSTITVPDPATITDLNVTIALTHSVMTELDVSLTAPDGNVVGLFTDVGATVINTASSLEMNATFDDEAAIPIGSLPIGGSINPFTVVSGMKYQPEREYRLSWFDGQEAAGAWTLTIADDTANANGGRLQGWSLEVCTMPPPEPACPIGSNPVTVYSPDFDISNGGFIHSGTADNWDWGVPIAAPITTAHSGSKVWKTNLSGPYANTSIQDLYSPAIDLSGVVGPVQVSWYQKYQMENATFDHYFVEAIPLSGTAAMTSTLFEWLDATMTTTFGSGSPTINESAGWGVSYADISAFAGGAFKLRYHLDSDSTNFTPYAGVAIDDVIIRACSIPAPTATATATATATETATATATNTATATATATATETATNTATATATETATNTATATETATATTPATATTTALATATATAPATATTTALATATATAPATAPATATATASATATVTATATEAVNPQRRLYLPLLIK